MAFRIVVVVILAGAFFSGRHVVTADGQDTLELLQVVVRHGNRSSHGIFTQLMQQYIEDFEPFEFGLLMPHGRRQVENSGQFLRERYADFLPQEYSYKSVSVKCTGSIRTMESALVTMAAMFPPKDRQRWQDSGLGAEWTPIPCQYVPKSQDTVFEPSSVKCPRYSQLKSDAHNSPEYVARLNQLTLNGSVIEYIQRSLNMSTTQPLSQENLQNVWENLHLLDDLQLPLPEWSKLIYPDPLHQIYHLHFTAYYGSPELITFSVGEYLREIMTIADALQNRELRPQPRKMYISFAHDLNIMPLLVALNLETNPPQPDYGGMVIMELHRIRETDEIGFKFLYRNVTWQEPTVYTMPNCQQICPLSFVKKTVEQYIPTVPFEELCSVGQD